MRVRGLRGAQGGAVTKQVLSRFSSVATPAAAPPGDGGPHEQDLRSPPFSPPSPAGSGEQIAPLNWQARSIAQLTDSPAHTCSASGHAAPVGGVLLPVRAQRGVAAVMDEERLLLRRPAVRAAREPLPKLGAVPAGTYRLRHTSMATGIPDLTENHLRCW